MYRLILVRHGESQWNKENKFTGWTDVPLSEKGVKEARTAGQILRDEGFEFDCAYTSVLKRAIKTLWLTLEEMDQMYIPIIHSWKLNERHYGALQGLNKAETAKKFGDEQVHIWRRGYDTPPPLLEENDPRLNLLDPRYPMFTPETLPRGESLKDTVARVVPFWTDIIAPDIVAGKRVLITAHGNSLRALVKHLDQISDKDIMDLNIPTGVPLFYSLDENLKTMQKKYLGEIEEDEL